MAAKIEDEAGKIRSQLDAYRRGGSVKVQSYVDVRPQFRNSVTSLINAAKSAYDSIVGNTQKVNYRPAIPDDKKWDGDLHKLNEMSVAFLREDHKVDVQKAIGDFKQSGTVGDLVASVKQGDYLAVQERAFRCLHAGRLRSSIHVGARLYGHQHEAGLFAKGVIGEISDAVRKAKDFAPA
jgi:hypothetical protein